MGWLYMRSLAGHATPKAYLDAQFTYDRDTGGSRVLASSLVGRRTYYAAVEWITAGSGVTPARARSNSAGLMPAASASRRNASRHSSKLSGVGASAAAAGGFMPASRPTR